MTREQYEQQATELATRILAEMGADDVFLPVGFLTAAMLVGSLSLEIAQQQGVTPVKLINRDQEEILACFKRINARHQNAMSIVSFSYAIYQMALALIVSTEQQDAQGEP